MDTATAQVSRPLVIVQVPAGKMAVFSYLVGEADGACAVAVDPGFRPQRLLDEARSRGWRIRQVVNTHGHPDHVAGNAALIQATGARLLIHADDAGKLAGRLNRMMCRLLGGRPSPAPDRLLVHGDTVAVGNGALEVVHTPGHSPGSICLHTPGHLITGDTLFVGAVGRTDLAGGDAGLLADSIARRILRLPGTTRIWPGHDYGPRPWSTVAQEAAENPFVRPLAAKRS